MGRERFHGEIIVSFKHLFREQVLVSWLSRTKKASYFPLEGQRVLSGVCRGAGNRQGNTLYLKMLNVYELFTIIEYVV